MNMKNKVIFWSGGFDSTLLLLETLKENYSDSVIQCVTVVSDRVGDAKNARERASRDHIKEYIKNKFPKAIIQYREIVVKTVDDNSFNEGFVTFGQALLWALTVIPFLEEDSVLLFGYLLNDHLSTCKFYGPFNTLLSSANELCQKNLTFDFPLITMSKEDVIREIIRHYPEILNLVTCCEGLALNDNCGSCGPCTNLKKSLIYLSTDPNQTVSIAAKNILKDRFKTTITVTEDNVTI